MKITDVRMTKLQGDKSAKAICNVTFDSCFVVSGIVVMEGSKGAFVKMPVRKSGEEWKDVCFPVTKEFRTELIDRVLQEYKGEEPQEFYPMDDSEDQLPF